MAFTNLVDNLSTTVSSSTPGFTVDLTDHATLRTSLLGVPVRFKVSAKNTVAGDTGAVKLVDAGGNVLITVLINGDTSERWYWANGYLPATVAKYDLHYGGNTLGSMTVFSASVYEIDWTTDPVLGELTATIGISLLAEGTGAAGVLASTLDPITISATGTVSTPAFQAVGSAGTGGSTTNVTVSWPTHVAGDWAILIVGQLNISSTDPGAATLATPSGFSAIAGASTVVASGSRRVRITAFSCLATSGAMAAPVVQGSLNTNTRAYIITARGANQLTPIDVVQATTQSTASTSVSITGATTTGVNRLVLIAIAANLQTAIATEANTDLTSVTERIDSSAADNTPSMSGTTGTKATAGAFTATTATFASSSAYVGLAIALQ